MGFLMMVKSVKEGIKTGILIVHAVQVVLEFVTYVRRVYLVVCTMKEKMLAMQQGQMLMILRLYAKPVLEQTLVVVKMLVKVEEDCQCVEMVLLKEMSSVMKGGIM